MTYDDSPSVTSLPASADGPTRSGSPDGPTTNLSGLAHAPASHSARRAKEREYGIRETFGPLFERSSPSADLQRSLESRLRARMAAYGSPEYELTWKHWDIPAGPLICALRASARRTSGKDFTGWHTPVSADSKGRKYQYDNHDHSKPRLSNEGLLTGLPTPMAGTPAQHGYNEAGSTDNARKTVALLMGWPSPAWHDGRRPALDMKSTQGTNLSRDAVRFLAGWATPTSRDYRSESATDAFNEKRWSHPRGKPLGAQVTLAGWATPNAPRAHDSDATAFAYYPETKNQTDPLLQLLGRQVSLSIAKTGSGGGYRLNHRFSLWLMGFPVEEWASCGERAMQSCHHLRQSLSKPLGSP